MQTLAPTSFRPVRSISWDFGLILAPALLWLAIVQSRSTLIHPSCIDPAHPCKKQEVFFVDQLSIDFQNGTADAYSYLTQNLSITLAITLPLLWNLYRAYSGRNLILHRLREMWADFCVGLQAILWNGLFTEMAHTGFHRPRPFIYGDLATQGLDPAHYTSFYSGHTSVTAAANVIVLLLLISRQAPTWLILADLGITEGLIFCTGYFRILAGRHFLTDVICGGIAGTLAALLVFAVHPKEPHSRLP